MKTVLVLLLGLIPAAMAVNCTTLLAGASGSVMCIGNVPREVNDPPETWARAVTALSNATSVQVELRDVRFSAVSFFRTVDILLRLGSSTATGSLDIVLTGCSLRGAEFDYASLSSLPGTKSFSIRIENSELVNNKVNMTGAFAVQSDFSLSLQLLNTTINRNKLMSLGLAAVGGAGQAAITVAQGSQVEENEAYLLGALAVGGAASLSVQLASANITRNELSQLGLVAVGGQAAASVNGLQDPSVVTANNTLDSRGAVATRQPLVTSVLDIVMGLGFNETGFDLAAALTRVQADVCSLLATLYLAELDIPADQQSSLQALADKVESLLCLNGGPNPAVNMTAVAAGLEGWLGQDFSGLAGVLESVLTNSSLVENLVAALEGKQPLGSALDDILQSLLSNPEAQEVLPLLADLIAKIGEWLGTPIGGGGAAPDKPANDGSFVTGSGLDLDLAGIIQDIIGSITGSSSGDAEGAVAGLAETLEGIVQQVLGAISGGGGTGGTDVGTASGDIINSIIGALTGGADSPLAGQDVSSLGPVLAAIFQDPNAVASLPDLLGGLLGGGGQGTGGQDLPQGLGPILSAILGDPQASAALPDVLGLLESLGIGNLGGIQGGGMAN